MRTFFSQIRGFLRRNLLLKIRNKAQTAPEIYNPISLLAVLIMINYLLPSERLPNVDYPPEPFPPMLYNLNNFYFVPDNAQTRLIGQKLKEKITIYNPIKYFDDVSDMQMAYLNDSGGNSGFSGFGLEFEEAKGNFPFDYKLHTKWKDSLFTYKSVNLFANGNVCRKNSTDYLNYYKDCAGNEIVYNDVSLVQYTIDSILKSVYIYDSFYLFLN